MMSPMQLLFPKKSTQQGARTFSSFLLCLPVDATDGGGPPQADAERKSSAGALEVGNSRGAQVMMSPMQLLFPKKSTQQGART